MLFHYLLLVLLRKVIEGKILRKTFTLLEEIEKIFHIKLYVIIMMIKVTLGLFVILGMSEFLMVKWHGYLSVL